ncbi:hypothetical protein E8K88_16270 [Lampropedia aestuarii]|uniref:Fibronectin type-III domain-containing protein n=1 Tax=Lampropedia aestuarii TaxID=2562762 RepID=A0A4S5BFK7_9BURK|nr:CARDB domain-containing protein [Lampropedia aestuarii]THJ31020.1 hypothetical protein E8K88_16270 [Lampropedia aestuarii]
MKKIKLSGAALLWHWLCAGIFLYAISDGAVATTNSLQRFNDLHAMYGQTKQPVDEGHLHAIVPKDFSLKSAASAKYLRDINGVPVIEVDGNFDAGEHGIRALVAQEFYKNHADIYDFLIFSTGFNFDLGGDSTLGFHSLVKNEVQGLGRSLLDNTSQYGSTGKLQATIDMGPVARMVLDPFNAQFDKPLNTFVHEVMHQWGAYVKYKDRNGLIRSDLLGHQGGHWSYLLDTGASIMYGQSWRDNGDGTFTAIDGREFLSPIDLYLMGMVGKDEVPPLNLLVAPAEDPNTINGIGDTIRATATSVTIDDIIAAQGPRIPSVENSQKDFHFAFIYLVRPGQEPSEADIAAINNLRVEASTRISAMTRGMATANSFVQPLGEGRAGEPSIFVTDGQPSPTPAGITAAASWLISKQQISGEWADLASTNSRDTTQAMLALQELQRATAIDASLATAGNWLSGKEFSSPDALSRKMQVLGRASTAHDIERLLVMQNTDGGWGFTTRHHSSLMDTALAVKALSQPAMVDGNDALSQAYQYLLAQQNADGGWSSNAAGVSQLASSAHMLEVLSSRLTSDQKSRAFHYLAAQQRADGGFGQEKSTSHETAEVLIAATRAGALDAIQAKAASNYLLAQQRMDGSWDGSVYATAVAIRALTGTDVPNWALERFTAAQTDVPAGVPVLLTALVKNTSGARVPETVLRTYMADVSGPKARQDISLPALAPGAQARIEFIVHTLGYSGALRLVAEVDPDDLVGERVRSDNVLSIDVHVGAPQTGVDLLITADDIVANPAQLSSLPADIQITALVTNAGSLAANAVKAVLWEGEEGNLKQSIAAEQVFSIGAQAQNTLVFDVILKRSGSRLYTVELDPDNAIGETNKENNIASVKVQTRDALDVALAQSDIQVAPTMLSAGVDAQIQVNVRNIGTVDTTDFTVQLVILDAQATEVSKQNVRLQIASGQTRTAEFTWRPATEGAHRLEVRLDPERVLSEQDTSNNFAAQSVQVGERYTGVNIAVSYKSISISPQPVRSAQATQLTASILNSGLSAAAGFDVEFFLGDPEHGGLLLATERVEALAAGAETTITTTWQDPRGQGQQLLYVVLDRAQELLELQRTDNSAFVVTEMLSLPDLAIGRANIQVTPEAPASGTTVSIVGTVANLGDLPAHDVVIAIFEEDAAQPLASRVLPVIEGKNSGSFAFSYLVTNVQMGPLVIKVDPEDHILELNEANNNAVIDLNAQDLDFYADQKFISPNGDGVKDDTRLRFRLASAEDVYITVVRKDNGRVVRTARDPVNWRAVQTGSWLWNGTDDRGVVVKDGDYSIQVWNSERSLGSAEVRVDNNRSSVVEAFGTRHGHHAVLIPPDSGWNVLHHSLRLAPYAYVSERQTVFGSAVYIIKRIDARTGAEIVVYSGEAMPQNFDPGVDGSRLVFYQEGVLSVTNAYGRDKKILKESDEYQDRSACFAIGDANNEYVYLQLNTKLYRYDVDGNEELIRDEEGMARRYCLSNESDMWEMLSPDRKFIADRSNGILSVETGDNSYYQIDQYTFNYSPRGPIWSPDASKLFFELSDMIRIYPESVYPNVNSKVVVYGIDGEILHDFGTGAFGAFWSDDSREIYYYNILKSECGGALCWGVGIYSLDVETKNIRLVYEFQKNTGNPPVLIRDKEGGVCAAGFYSALISYLGCGLSLESGVAINPQDSFKALYPTNLDGELWVDGYSISRLFEKKFLEDRIIPAGPSNGGILRGALDEQNGIFYYKNTDSSIMAYSSTQNMSAMVRVSRVPGGRALRISGTADDMNFLRYSIEYRKEGQSDWAELALPSNAPVRRGVFVGAWVPPGIGVYEIKLTVEDRAGNKRAEITRINYGINPAVTDLKLSEQYISPNGDGVQDDVKISFRVLEPVNFDIEILDESGHLVRRVELSYPSGGVTDEYVWNGRDQNGSIVPDGSYRIVAADFEWVLGIDTAPPISLKGTHELLFMDHPFFQKDDQNGMPCQIIKGSHRSWENNVDGKRVCLNTEALGWSVQDENPGKMVLQRRRLGDGYWIDIYSGNYAASDPHYWSMKDYELLSGDEYRIVADDLAGNISINVGRLVQDVSVVFVDGEAVELGINSIVDAENIILEAASTYAEKPRSVVLRISREDVPVMSVSAVFDKGFAVAIVDTSLLDSGERYQFHFLFDFINAGEQSTRNHELSFSKSTDAGESADAASVHPGSHIDYSYTPPSLFDERVRYDVYLQSDEDLRYLSPVYIGGLLFRISGDFRACVKYFVIIKPYYIDTLGQKIYYSEGGKTLAAISCNGLSVKVASNPQACSSNASSPLSIELNPNKSASSSEVPNLDHLVFGRRIDGVEDIFFNAISPSYGTAYFSNILPASQSGEWFARMQDVEGKTFETPVELTVDFSPPLLQITNPHNAQKVCGRMIYDVYQAIPSLRAGVEIFSRIDDPEGWLYFSSVRYINPGKPYARTTFRDSPSPSMEVKRGDVLREQFPKERDAEPIAINEGYEGPISRLFDFTGEVAVDVKVSNWAGMQTCESVQFYVDASVDVDLPTLSTRLFSPTLEEMFVFGNADEAVTLQAVVYETKTEIVEGRERLIPNYDRPVRRFDPLSLQPGKFEIVWDGNGDGATRLPDGMYAFEFVFTDDCGLTKTFSALDRSSLIFEIDATAPALAIDFPGAGDALSMLVGVIGSATDRNFHAWGLEYAFGHAPEDEDWVSIANGGGAQQNAQFAVWNMLHLEPGPYSLRLKAIDKPGNEAQLVVPVERVDAQWLLEYAEAAPELFSPNGDNRLDVAALRFGLQGESLVTVRVLRAGVPVALLLDTVRLPAGTHTVQWDGLTRDRVPAVDGVYHWMLEVHSALNPGLMQAERIQLVLDATAPALQFSVVDGQHIKGETEVRATVQDMHLEEYAISVQQNGLVTPLLSGTESLSALSIGDLREFEEGPLTLRVRASDRAATEAMLNVDVVIDNTAPVLALVEPADGSYHSGSELKPIEAGIDELNLKRWTLSLVDQAGVQQLLYEGGSWPLLSSLTWRPSDHADGNYSLQLTAEDHAGWVSSLSHRVVVDSTAPIASIELPAQSAAVEGETPVIGTATDANLEEYLLEVAPGVISQASRWTTLERASTGVNNEQLGMLPALPDGVYTLRLTVLDKAGNRSEAITELRFNNGIPGAIVLTGAIEAGERVRLNWNLTEPVPIKGYHVEQNGVQLTSALLEENTYLVDQPGGGAAKFVVIAHTETGRTLRSNEVSLTLSAPGLQAFIASPRNSAVVSGTVQVLGTAHSSRQELREYTLELAPGSNPQPSDFETVRRSTIGVQNGVLGQWDTAGLAEGSEHTLLLSVWDIEARVQRARITVSVDNVAPAKPTGLTGKPMGSDVSLAWDANTEADLAGYLLYRDGELVNGNEESSSPITAYLLHTNHYLDQQVPDGASIYTVQAVDQAGNVSALSDPAGVQLDNRAPKAIITSPQSETRVNAAVVLLATVEDKDVASVQFEFRLEGQTQWERLGSALTQEPFTVPWNPAGLSMGPYEFRAVATDRNHNVDPEPAAIRLVYTDTPVRTATARVDGRRVTIDWVPSDVASVREYQVVKNGCCIWQSVEAGLNTLSFDGMSDDLHVFEIYSRDASGNRVDQTLSVTALVHTPTLEQPYSPVATRSVDLQGKGTKEHTAELRVAHDGGEELLSVEVGSDGQFKFVDVPLATGRNDFSLVLLDDLGNRSNRASAYIVTAIPPATPLNVTSDIGPDAQVSLQWDANSEPDILGYAVLYEGGLTAQQISQWDYLEVDALIYRVTVRSSYQGEVVLRAHDGFGWIPLAKAVLTGGAYTFDLDVPYKTSRLSVQHQATNYPEFSFELEYAPVFTETQWTGQLPNGELELAVIAVNTVGLSSPPSDPIKLEIDNGVELPQAQNLTVSLPAQANALQVDWQHPAPMGTVDRYHLYRALQAGGPYQRIASLDTGSDGYLDSGLVGGKSYFYVVRMADALGNESAASNEDSGVPRAAIEGAQLFFPAQSNVPFHTSRGDVAVHGMAVPGASVQLRSDGGQVLAQAKATESVESTQVQTQLALGSWSPDGRYLVTHSVSRWQLYGEPAQGQGFSLIRSQASGVDSDITWSPDSQYFAYTNAGQIWIHHVADGVTVNHTASDVDGMDWSREYGLTFALNGSLYALESVTSEPKLLLQGDNNQHPRWSPDGRMLLYMQSTSDSNSTNRSVVSVLNPETHETEQVTSILHSFRVVPPVEWSRDGATILWSEGDSRLMSYRLSDGLTTSVFEGISHDQVHILPYTDALVFRTANGYQTNGDVQDAAHFQSIPGNAAISSVLAGGQVAYTQRGAGDWVHALVKPAGMFVFTEIPLAFGDNRLTAHASSALGSAVSDPVSIVRASQTELLPDLEVRAEQILLIPSVLHQGETTRVAVRVFNIGTSPSRPVRGSLVAVHNGDAQTIGQLNVPAIAAGSSASLTLDWTPLQSGTYQLVVSIDPERSVSDANRDNNIAWRDATVLAVGQSLDMTLKLDKGIYQPTEQVAIELELLNGGARASGVIKLFVEDEQGYLVATLPDIAVGNIDGGQRRSFEAHWTSGNTLPGAYRVRAQLRSGSNTLAQTQAAFSIAQQQGTAVARIFSDRSSYVRANSLNLTGTVDFSGFGAEVAQVPVTITIRDPNNTVVFTDTRQYAPRERITMHVVWAFGSLPYGAYQASIDVASPAIAQSETSFALVDSGTVQYTGSLSLSADKVLQGDSFTVEAIVANTGTALIERLPVRLVVTETHSGRVVVQRSDTVTVVPGESARISAQFNTLGWLLRAHTVSLQVDGSAIKTAMKTYSVLHQKAFSVYEAQPPVVAILSPTAGSFVPEAPVLRASAYDLLSNISLVEYRIQGGVWREMEPEPGSSAVYAAQLGALADGAHTAEVRASDTFGNQSPLQSVEFIVDSLPPRIAIEGVVNGERYDQVTPLIEISDLYLATAQVRLNGAAYESGTPVTKDGSYSLEVRASDLAGNTSVSAVTFFVGTGVSPSDEAPPVVSILQPAAGSYLKNAAELQVSAVDADSGVAEVVYQIGTGPWQGMQPTADPAQFSASLAHLTDGAYSVAVVAADLSGNRSDATSVAFVVDATAPVIRIEGVEREQKYLTAVTIRAQFLDLNLERGELQLNGQPFSNGALVEEPGVYVLTAYALDKAGNESHASVRFEILAADVLAPLVTIVQPTDGAVLTQAGQLVVNAVDEQSGMGTVEYRLNGGAWQELAAQADPEMFEAALGDLEAATHTVEARATDVAGNVSQPVSTRFTIAETTVPMVEIVQPASGSYLQEAGLLSVRVLSAVAIERTEYRLDGGPWLPVPGAGGDMFEVSLNTLSEGERRLEVRAIDMASTMSQVQQRRFYIDRTAPQVSVLRPEKSSYFNSQQAPLVVDALDAISGVASVEYRLGAGAWAAMAEQGSTYSVLLAQLAEGLQSLELRATDKAGNQAMLVHPFIVDTVAPLIEVRGVVNGQRFDPSTTPSLTPSIVVTDENLDSYQITLNGQTYVPGSSIALSLGTYQLVIEALDKAGNRSQATIGFVAGDAVTAAPIPVPLLDKDGVYFLLLLCMLGLAYRYGRWGSAR